MIITQPPKRQLSGMWQRCPWLHGQEEGCVLSSAIDKYIFVIKERLDNKTRVGYTRTEMVDDLGEVQHDLVREALATWRELPFLERDGSKVIFIGDEEG